MGGGKGGGNSEAKQARADEQARQMKVRQGTTRINEIFDGTYSPSGDAVELAQALGGKTYYDASGRKIDVGQGEDPSDAWAKRALADFGGDVSNAQQLAVTKQNLAGQKLYTQGTRQGGFGDDFFKKRRQAYIDYATPQLEDQYGDAQKELTFALSRSGLLDSSTRGQKVGQLQKLYDTQKQKVADDALTQETQARNAIEDARSNLVTTLNATGDAEGAANSAIARSQALSQAPSYAPLTQLFTDFTAGLGTQMAAERSAAAGGPASRYSTGLFGPRAGSVRNTP